MMNSKEFDISKAIESRHIEFKNILIMGKPRDNHTSIHMDIFKWLLDKKFNVFVEKSLNAYMENLETHYFLDINQIDGIDIKINLVIVIGGDGNMLSATRILAKHKNIAIVGINKGNLGFLTDINPNPETIFEQLTKILYHKEYFVESRFLLEAKIICAKQEIKTHNALNEIVIHPTHALKMITFDVFIDDQLAFSQKADGFLVATPTGSTAYALSAGGPILHPNLDAITLMSMFPHMLSARPIIVKGDSVIKLKLDSSGIQYKVSVSCDGQEIYSDMPNYEILIYKSKDKLNLIHVDDYNYYNVLTSKLGWLSR